MVQRRTLHTGKGRKAGIASLAAPRFKPLKRPLQARAKFTVQAIYDAFLKLWRAGGWNAVTTRAVALEAGVSVGTLYEYFPNKESLLSGYVRHCIDALLDAIEQQAIAPQAITWQERVHRLIALSCGLHAEPLPEFDRDMLMLEHQIAEQKHHSRVFDEMIAKWQRTFDACTDLPRRPDPGTVKALFVSVWGGRRYLLLVGEDDLDAQQWAGEMERLCRTLLER